MRKSVPPTSPPRVVAVDYPPPRPRRLPSPFNEKNREVFHFYPPAPRCDLAEFVGLRVPNGPIARAAVNSPHFCVILRQKNYFRYNTRIFDKMRQRRSDGDYKPFYCIYRRLVANVPFINKRIQHLTTDRGDRGTLIHHIIQRIIRKCPMFRKNINRLTNITDGDDDSKTNCNSLLINFKRNKIINYSRKSNACRRLRVFRTRDTFSANAIKNSIIKCPIDGTLPPPTARENHHEKHH